jgi:hypothetical protein
MKAEAGGDRRGWLCVHGVDDLAAIDAPEVGGRDAEIGVPELPLDHNGRNSLVRHFDRVSVPQLMRREPRLAPASAAARRSVSERPMLSSDRPAVRPTPGRPLVRVRAIAPKAAATVDLAVR